jgi:hypothetical protein
MTMDEQRVASGFPHYSSPYYSSPSLIKLESDHSEYNEPLANQLMSMIQDADGVLDVQRRMDCADMLAILRRGKSPSIAQLAKCGIDPTLLQPAVVALSAKMIKASYEAVGTRAKDKLIEIAKALADDHRGGDLNLFMASLSSTEREAVAVALRERNGPVWTAE